jgi:hypothetical protein
MISRVRVWVPPPQLTVQDPKEPHPPTTQSTGHGEVEHDCVSLKAGHAAPPFALLTMMTRVRVWVPPPQLTVQDANELQSPTAQFTGHGIPGSSNYLVRQPCDHIVWLHTGVASHHLSFARLTSVTAEAEVCRGVAGTCSLAKTCSTRALAVDRPFAPIIDCCNGEGNE